MQSMTLVWFMVFIRISDQNTRYTLVYQSMTCVQINSKYIIQLPLIIITILQFLSNLNKTSTIKHVFSLQKLILLRT